MELVQNVITMVIILIAIHLNLKIIPALGHSWGSTQNLGYEPTSANSHAPLYSHTCSRCGASEEWHGGWSGCTWVSQGVHGSSEYFRCPTCGNTKQESIL